MWLSEKKEFRNNLTTEDITDVDCKHGKKDWQDFEIQNVGKYNELYL